MQREEEETARLYQEFVESFQEDTTPGSKVFVRGGTINPNEKAKADSQGWCHDKIQKDCFYFYLGFFFMC